MLSGLETTIADHAVLIAAIVAAAAAIGQIYRYGLRQERRTRTGG